MMHIMHHSVHPPPFCWGGVDGGGGVEPLTKFSKRRSLTGSQFLEGSCWERGERVTFFKGEGVAVFT